MQYRFHGTGTTNVREVCTYCYGGRHVGNLMIHDSHRHVSAAAEIEAIPPSSLVFATGPKDWPIISAVANARGDGEGGVGFGYHPWHLEEAADLSSGGSDWITSLRTKLMEHPRAFVGEIGLDKLRDAWQLQLQACKAQLQLAGELKRPVSLHCVKAWSPMNEMLASVETLPPAIVFHGYSGSAETIDLLHRTLRRRKAQTLVYFGVGALTTLKTKNFAKTLQAIPPGRLLVESDQFSALQAEELLKAAADVISEHLGEGVIADSNTAVTHLANFVFV